MDVKKTLRAQILADRHKGKKAKILIPGGGTHMGKKRMFKKVTMVKKIKKKNKYKNFPKKIFQKIKKKFFRAPWG